MGDNAIQPHDGKTHTGRHRPEAGARSASSGRAPVSNAASAARG